jgi:hydrogenase nickel incorporation protein HypA/HybF
MVPGGSPSMVASTKITRSYSRKYSVRCFHLPQKFIWFILENEIVKFKRKKCGEERMHEMSIAQSVLEIVNDTLQQNPGSKLKKVVVKVGELVAPLEGSELVIEVIPVAASCQDCGREFKVDSFFFVCPHCESAQVKVLSGQELQVSELEVE